MTVTQLIHMSKNRKRAEVIIQHQGMLYTKHAQRVSATGGNAYNILHNGEQFEIIIPSWMINSVN